MCWCDIVSKAKIGGLKHLGNGMEGSLRFFAEIIVGLSIHSCISKLDFWHLNLTIIIGIYKKALSNTKRLF